MEADARNKLTDNLKSQAYNFWNKLNSEENPEELNSNKTVQQKLWSIARQTNRRVIESYNNIKNAPNLISNNARNFYKELNAKDVREFTIRTMSTGVEKARLTMANILTPFVLYTKKMINIHMNNKSNHPNANSMAWPFSFLDLSNTSTFSNPSNIFNNSHDSNISNASDDESNPNAKPSNK